MAVKKFKPNGTTMVNGREVEFVVYKVTDSDTVYGTWLKYRDKTTVGAIKSANALTSNDLTVGKKIKIPLVL